MPAFTRKFSQEIEDAIASAYEDRGVRPMRHLLDLAESGELVPNLEPVTVPMATARGWVLKLRKRRAGVVKSKAAESTDAVQLLRKRLLAMCDGEIAFEERKRPGNRDPERIRQLARALREAAALPEKGQAVRPGDRSPDTGRMDNGGATAGGLAGGILSAARMGVNRIERGAANTHTQGEEAHDAAQSAHEHTEQGSAGWQGGAASDRATEHQGALT